MFLIAKSTIFSVCWLIRSLNLFPLRSHSHSWTVAFAGVNYRVNFFSSKNDKKSVFDKMKRKELRKELRIHRRSVSQMMQEMGKVSRLSPTPFCFLHVTWKFLIGFNYFCMWRRTCVCVDRLWMFGNVWKGASFCSW